MLKILQARPQQYVNCELPDVQAGLFIYLFLNFDFILLYNTVLVLPYIDMNHHGFRKGRGTRDQIANIRWIMEKARVPEKQLLLLY